MPIGERLAQDVVAALDCVDQVCALCISWEPTRGCGTGPHSHALDSLHAGFLGGMHQAQDVALHTPDARVYARSLVECTHIVERIHRDPDMLAWLYFADDMKIGIYVPLFGPVFLTLLVGGFRILKQAAQSLWRGGKTHGK